MGDRAVPSLGVFDSGVGGLSVLREMRALMPAETMIYVADQGHVPYGPRSLEQVRAFTEGGVRFLLAQGVRVVVIACNAASAAALYHARAVFPDVPLVGMEPAVKPAARDTRTGVIGVIATLATFQGELFASVVGRFAQDVQVETSICPEFVMLAEAGDTDSPAAREIVHRRLAPLAAAGIDQLVLGCTHFPFLKAAIQADLGPGVTIVDPSPAVALQARRVLETHGGLDGRSGAGHITYYTSGHPAAFRRTVGALLGPDEAASADVRGLFWSGNTLIISP